MSKVHALKIDPEHYKAIKDNTKNFEIRYNDRNYQTGDQLVLHEYNRDSHQFSNEKPIEAVVTYLITESQFLKPGYVCMGIRRTDNLLVFADNSDEIEQRLEAYIQQEKKEEREIEIGQAVLELIEKGHIVYLRNLEDVAGIIQWSKKERAFE
jgi:hypothetical protein